MKQSVLVIGAGIAGIQASIDLAQMGLQVYLVERSPSIGGRMAQLDKTFPTNDCAICILAPKMIECANHENVHLLTYSEVAAIEGHAGNFRVNVRKKPRYVDPDRCTGCGECVEKCPRRVSDEFNLNLNRRRAIYIPFPQAVPRVMTVDAEHCLYLTDLDKDRCRLCEEVCQAGAINWEQQEEIVELDIGAIVIATGFDPYDASELEEYGFGRIQNVINGLQYERLVSASGPTGGELLRPSDGAHPHTVAFIQCVGSRDMNHNPYCSSVCCMFATKEAILANEHDPELKPYIFYTDLRAGGKRFQEYITRAEDEYQVTYIRGRPGNIGENPETGNPVVRYEDTTARQVHEMEVDLVVLCQALVPRHGQQEIAKVLGIVLDEYGFVHTPERLLYPVDTSVPGIFACGYCQSPQDIPDSVTQASGTAARVAELLCREEMEHKL
ncbi:MAG: CoB--CoM heterodisulfide reductase iron-sulfur subunit A family protein [Anaerolineaceae bacterium]|nr:MAG: CoB--CoM heterodisulfide reductase iron-sulfur subunit A family protein [Anaerolineaceae bacterium]